MNRLILYFKKLFASIVLFGLSLGLLAQEPNIPLTKGDKIRITSSILGGKKKLIFTSIEKGSLQGHTDKAYNIPLGSIHQIEILRGTKRATGKGMLYGALGGATTGAIVGASINCRNLYDGNVSEQRCVGLFGGLGAVGGLVIGAVVGSAALMDRWVRISNQELNTLIVPQNHSGFGMSIILKIE